MSKRLSRRTLLKGVRELAERDKDLAKIVSTHGPPPLWEREQGFPTLIHIILEQQVSLASAKAAYTRLEEAADPLTPKNLLGLTSEELRQIGFSRQKTSYARELARAIVDGSLDLSGLAGLEDDEARKRLMEINRPPPKGGGLGSPHRGREEPEATAKTPTDTPPRPRLTGTAVPVTTVLDGGFRSSEGDRAVDG